MEDVEMTNNTPAMAGNGESVIANQDASARPTSIDDEIAAVLKPGKTLMPLQRTAVEWMTNNPRCMFSDDMGLGKTLAALVTAGIMALRSKNNEPFLCLICVRNTDHIRNWQRDICTFVKDKFFTVITMNSDTEELPAFSPRTLVFCTYARMRKSFAKALELLPDGVIAPASRKRGIDKTCSRLVSISAIAPNEKVEDDDEDEERWPQQQQQQQRDDAAPQPMGLANAILGTVGYRQACSETAQDKEGESHTWNNRRKQNQSVNVQRFESHSMATISSRRKIFASDPDYWTPQRVDPSTALPCAPLLKRHPDHPTLYSYSWSGIIFDEAHELKAIAAAQTKAALFLHYTRMMLWQSGTPIQNKLMEIRSGLLMIREPHFCGETEQINGPDGIPYRGETLNEARALRAIPRIMFRRSTEDIVRSNPEVLAQDSRTSFLLHTKIDRGIVAENWYSAEERNLHNQYVSKLKALAERLLVKKTHQLAAKTKGKKAGIATSTNDDAGDGGEKESLLTAYTRALQVCAAATVINNSDNPVAVEQRDVFDTKSTKMQMLLKVIRNQIPQGEKIIVFDHRVEVLRVAARMLTANGYPAVLIASEFSETQRATRLEQWRHEGSGVNVLLAQTTMCGTGHTWTEARYVIHLTPSFNPATEDQANARAWRVGQTSDVTVFVLLVAGSVEELVLEMQWKKRAENKRVLSSAELATKANKLPKLNPEEVIRHAVRILDSAGGQTLSDTGAYRARNDFEEKKNLDRVRNLFKGPNWVTEKMLADGDIYFLDPRRSYSEAGFLPRGSMIFTVQSWSHFRANELSYAAERSRQRIDPLMPAITKTLKSKRMRRVMADASGNAQQSAAASASQLPGTELPRNMRIALCPVSLYVLLCDEFYGELSRLATLYNDRRTAHIRVTGRPYVSLEAAGPGGLFRASNPPGVPSSNNIVNADMRGPAYQAMAQALGNRAVKPGGMSGSGYNLEMLNTPAEIAGALKEYFQPMFGVLHPVDAPLQRARHVSDTYHYRTQPNGFIELRGTTAAMLTDPRCSLNSSIFRAFPLNVDVLLSFAPLWHMPGFGLSERLCTLHTPPADAIDLYDAEHEETRRKLHWMYLPQVGSDPLPKDSMIPGRSEFPASSIRYILAPLLAEAATAMCSTHVRAMATAVMLAFALSGSEACKVYLLACGDLQLQGAGSIQAVLVAVRVRGDTLVGAGLYQRCPIDSVHRDVLTGTAWRAIRSDKAHRNMINAQRQLMSPLCDGWQEKPRTNPVYYNDSNILNWGAYAEGYSCYTRNV